jgi:hypothetical protein
MSISFYIIGLSEMKTTGPYRFEQTANEHAIIKSFKI